MKMPLQLKENSEIVEPTCFTLTMYKLLPKNALL